MHACMAACVVETRLGSKNVTAASLARETCFQGAIVPMVKELLQFAGLRPSSKDVAPVEVE